MSGQQEPRGELDRFDQPDPRDSALDLSGLISRLDNGSLSNGNNGRGEGGQDNCSGVGNNVVVSNNAVVGNSGVAGISPVKRVGGTGQDNTPPRPAPPGPHHTPRAPPLPSPPP